MFILQIYRISQNHNKIIHPQALEGKSANIMFRLFNFYTVAPPAPLPGYYCVDSGSRLRHQLKMAVPISKIFGFIF